MLFATNLLSLVLTLAATSAWASPLTGMREDQTLYKLQISSSKNSKLDGEWVVSNGTTLGVFAGDSNPITVYTLQNEKGGMELHTYPIGIVDHALGLHGRRGLMTFVEMVNPKKEKGGDDGLVSYWDTFRVSEDEKLVNEGDGRWFAFPTFKDSWVVKWYDNTIGDAITADYVDVEIIMEVVDTSGYNPGD